MSIGKVFLIFIMLCFIGCGGGTWVHEDKNKDLDADKKECKGIAWEAGLENPTSVLSRKLFFKSSRATVPDKVLYKKAFDNCMTEKGWKQE